MKKTVEFEQETYEDEDDFYQEEDDDEDDSSYYDYPDIPERTGNNVMDNAVLWEAERESVLVTIMESLTGQRKIYDRNTKKYKIVTFNKTPLAPLKAAKKIVDYLRSFTHKGAVLTITSDVQVQQMVISAAIAREQLLDELQMNFDDITDSDRRLMSEIIENNLIFLYNASLYGFSLKMLKAQISLNETRSFKPEQVDDERKESFWDKANKKATKLTRKR